jgi:hypothetical protein
VPLNECTVEVDILFSLYCYQRGIICGSLKKAQGEDRFVWFSSRPGNLDFLAGDFKLLYLRTLGELLNQL